jgi:hypothetical protein
VEELNLENPATLNKEEKMLTSLGEGNGKEEEYITYNSITHYSTAYSKKELGSDSFLTEWPTEKSSSFS